MLLAGGSDVVAQRAALPAHPAWLSPPAGGAGHRAGSRPHRRCRNGGRRRQQNTDTSITATTGALRKRRMVGEKVPDRAIHLTFVRSTAPEPSGSTPALV